MNSTGWLFDTNILSDLIRRPHGLLAQRIIALDAEERRTSIVVACELRYGAVKSGTGSLQAKVDQLLDLVHVLPIQPGVDHHYAEIRSDLEKAGSIIGRNDLLIAAHARALGATLVTANVAEFDRVPGLAVQNWLAFH